LIKILSQSKQSKMTKTELINAAIKKGLEVTFGQDNMYEYVEVSFKGMSRRYTFKSFIGDEFIMFEEMRSMRTGKTSISLNHHMKIQRALFN
jgi:hypothetical protein